MPLQNRIDPWGQLNAVNARGTLMGNRGILADHEGHIVAPWRHRAWVTCRLEFKRRHRDVFSQGHYSELFFLDEATAFAAGHRPCAECRHDRYQEFKRIWCAANRPGVDPRSVKAALIDAQLHQERASRGGGKVTYSAALASLPDGVMVELRGSAWLVWRGRLHRWSHSGYEDDGVEPSAKQGEVVVLTPRSITETFRLGFVPQWAGADLT